MTRSNVETEVAALCSVAYDSDTDDMYVTFKVHNDEYKDLVLRLASRPDIQVLIRGEKMYIGGTSDIGTSIVDDTSIAEITEIGE